MSNTTRLLLFGLVGALLGTGGSDSTPVLGAALGVLLALHLRDTRRLKELESQVREQSSLAITDNPATASRSSTPAQGELLTSPAEETPLSLDPITEDEQFVPRPEGIAAEPPTDPPRRTRETVRPVDRPAIQRPPLPPREPDPVTLALRRAWTFATGGNPIARIALLVLFVGLGLLIRYASEQGFFPIEARLALTAAAGAVLVGLGWFLRKKATALGLTLQGGGVAVLYLTTYAAYTQFGFLSSPLAILLMALIAAGCAALALVQDEPPLAVIGVAGGFAAPILAGSGAGGHILLFSYYALLNLGVLGIAWFRGWRSVALVGFAATFVTGGLWGGLAYSPALYATTQPFLVLSFAIYLILAVRFAVRSLTHDGPPERALVVDGALVFGLPAATFALQIGLVEGIPYGRGWSAVALAVVYLVGAAVMYRRDGGLRLLADAFLAIGLVFATLAVPLFFQKVAVGALWVLEGAALVWTGARQGRAWMRWSGVALQVVAAGVLLDQGIVDPDRTFSTATLTGWIVALALGLSSYVIRFMVDDGPYERIARAGLLGFGLFWWGATVLTHALDLSPGSLEWTVLLTATGISSALFRSVGGFLRWPGLRTASLGVVPVGALLLLVQLFVVEHPFEMYAWAGWLVIAGSTAFALRGAAPPGLRRLAFAGAAWLAVGVLAFEASWAVDQAMRGDGWPPAAVGVVIALGILISLRWPSSSSSEPERHLAAGGLSFAGIVWLLATLSWPGSAFPMIYLPVLAPLDLASILVVAALVDAARRAAPRSRGSLLTIIGLLGFLALTASVGRAVHHLGGVAFSFDALSTSSVYQATLAVVWTLLAVGLTVYATRRAQRGIWFAGVALLGLVVVKLFLVDLSQAAALVRIGAFLVVGVLGLIVAYTSPLPPKSEPHEPPESTPH